MTGHARFVLIAVSAALGILAARSECRADLFAVGTSAAEIYRIDADTGQVVDTYAVPSGLPNSFARSGLAFDGRVLYLTVGNSRADSLEILRFDVVADQWLDATSLDMAFMPSFESIGGLGYARFPDRKTLVAIQSNPFSPMSGPLVLNEIPLTDRVPAEHTIPYNYDFSFSPVLYPGNSGTGLDVDPVNGDIWATTTDLETGDDTLFQVHPLGFILQTIPLTLEATPSGIGFDDGRLFVVDVTRHFYELDRANGSVLNTFSLPGPGLIGALTGGEVAPEPATAALVLPASMTVLVMRRRRASSQFA